VESEFGARLRMHRERQQVDLAAVAEQTKIKLSLLEGLERDDVSHWPRGIFRRSYVRTYAVAIGLDPEPIIREFLERHPDPDEDVRVVLAAAGEAVGRPPTRLRFLVDTAIGALSKRCQSPPEVPPAAVVAARTRDDCPVRVEREGIDRGGTAAGALATDDPVPVDARPHEADVIEQPGLLLGAEPEVAVAHDCAEVESTASSAEADLHALAHLCTRLGRAGDLGDVEPVLEEAVRALDAVGLILWLSDPGQHALVPVLAAGYPDDLIGRLPGVRRDSDTALAVAFRSGEPCVVEGHDAETGAVSVPVTTPYGCAGVLAIELRDGAERRSSVAAFASILAAQLATLVTLEPRVEAMSA
jgi:hypothetical protein